MQSFKVLVSNVSQPVAVKNHTHTQIAPLLSMSSLLHVSQKQPVFLPVFLKNKNHVSLWWTVALPKTSTDKHSRETPKVPLWDWWKENVQWCQWRPGYLYKAWGVWVKRLKRWEREWKGDGEEGRSSGEGRACSQAESRERGGTAGKGTHSKGPASHRNLP